MKKPKTKVKEKKPSKLDQLLSEIETLESQYESCQPDAVTTFDDLPLSAATRAGLAAHEFRRPTEVQRQAIPLALRGHDIVGAAKTGSGKTLAFLVPMLELLYRCRWSRSDGLGALIITPTRELAYQIFAVLNRVGERHDFSAGLIIGGKDLKFERKRMDQVNIMICTPGRLLQHMDENDLLTVDNLQMLVLDEADRCLDMGFARAMNAILQHLPKQRQTLLFSATQTKSVSDLVRVSLQRPMLVSAHALSGLSTPHALAHSYIVCASADKIDTLWSFVKHHRHHKILVFVQTCKQAKYMHEIFSRLRPGVTVLALHGSMHQLRRMAVYDQFCRKQTVLMFATDVAARGLDFPAVHWVIQMDCPESVNTYIHRAGRTARNESDGECLLFLTPSEEKAMIEQLIQNRVNIEKIQVNSAKTSTAQRKLEALLARDVTLKESAKRALKCYCKAVALMKDKRVFNVETVDIEALARSMGLAVAPRVRFLKRQQQQQQQQGAIVANGDSTQVSVVSSQQQQQEQQEGGGEQKGAESEQQWRPLFRTGYRFHDTDGGATCDGAAAAAAANGDDVMASGSDSDDMAGGVLRLKRPAPASTATAATSADVTSSVRGSGDDSDALEPVQCSKRARVVSKVAAAKRALKKSVTIANVRVTFDDTGEALLDGRREQTSELARQYRAGQWSARGEGGGGGGIDIESAKLIMAQEDVIDRKRERELIRAKHREKKMKLKKQRQEQQQQQQQQQHEEEEHEDSESGSCAQSCDRDSENENEDVASSNGDNSSAQESQINDCDGDQDFCDESDADEHQSEDDISGDSDEDESLSPNRSSTAHADGVTVSNSSSSAPGHITQSRSVAEDERMALSLLTS